MDRYVQEELVERRKNRQDGDGEFVRVLVIR